MSSDGCREDVTVNRCAGLAGEDTTTRTGAKPPKREIQRGYGIGLSL